jgi:hypothetical protein
MGWLWASGPVQDERRQREPRASETTESSASAQVASQSTDDLDPEIAKFLEMIQAEIGSNKKQPDQTPKVEAASAPSERPPPRALSWLNLLRQVALLLRRPRTGRMHNALSHQAM